MKKILFVLTFLIGLSIPTVSFADELQETINKAKPHDVIDLKNTQYTTPITISKPLTLKGGVFRVKENKPAITIRSNDVTIDGVSIFNESKNATAAIDSSGKNTTLINNTIHTNTIGIQVNKSTNSFINNNTIDGVPTHNGIHITKTAHATIANNQLSHTKDGIYLEYCTDFLLEKNTIKKGRYGIHIMFGNNHKLQFNNVSHNIIGFMIMSTEHIQVENNTVQNQLENVNASGITIFDVTNCEVINNIIKHNRYGIILQNAKQNDLTRNLFSQNIIAMQFLQSHTNTFTENNFIGNAVSAENLGSTKNTIKHNYWDTNTAIDWNGDNNSDIPYHLQSFFIRLQRMNEGYSLLFNQPGLSILETLMPPAKESALTDEAPLLTSSISHEKKEQSASNIWFSIGLIVVLSYLWYIGGRSSK
ncbi:MAG: nitrous oxide reductase family maturation protein NosD [Bacillaceae bacterium]